MNKFKENWTRLPRWLRITIYSILGVLGAAAIGVLFGFVIMWLWNWLMPALFGLKTITYWQGVGIFILAKILFGAIGSGNGETKKPKVEKAHESDSHQADSSKVETEDVKYYDEWWEKEGKTAFNDFINNRCAPKNEKDTHSETGNDQDR